MLDWLNYFYVSIQRSFHGLIDDNSAPSEIVNVDFFVFSSCTLCTFVCNYANIADAYVNALSLHKDVSHDCVDGRVRNTYYWGVNVCSNDVLVGYNWSYKLW